MECLEDRALLAVISGVVFEDQNADGRYAPGDPGMAGIQVFLDTNNNTVFDSGEPVVRTGNDGSYAFSSLAAGDYIVRQVVPANYEQTAPAGEERLFATTFAGTHRIQELDPLTGTVLHEIPAPNTQANFTFHGLAFDNDTLFYYENYAKVLYELDPDTGAVIDFTPLDQAFANRNIGGLAAMHGLVYMLDATVTTAAASLLVFDPQSDQVTAVYSLAGNNVERGLAALPHENLLVMAVVEDQFKFLDPSTGAVRESVPLSGISSLSTVSGLAVIDDEIYLTTGGSTTNVFSRDGALLRRFTNPVESGGLAGGGGDGAHHVTVTAESSLAGLDFGNRPLAGTVRGTAFIDRNGNGSRDGDELPLGNVTIYLDTNGNGQFDAALERAAATAGDGSYAFDNLAPGPYTIRQLTPSNHVLVTEGNDPGVFVGTAYVPSTGQMNYVEIDGLTGAVDRIGAPFDTRLHGLVKTNSGAVFAFDGNSDAFYEIDPDTGALTLIGQSNVEFGWGLAYDTATDTIYGVGQVNAQDPRYFLIEVDRTTGQAATIGAGMEVPHWISGIAFDAEAREVVAFSNNNSPADQVYIFDLAGNGRVTSLPVNHTLYSLTRVRDQYVYGGWSVANTLRSIDFTTGSEAEFLRLSETTPLESLDWDYDPEQHRVLLAAGAEVDSINFGYQPENAPPVARAGGLYALAEGTSITLSAIHSTDPNHDPLTYAWDLNGDGIFSDAEGATVSLSWSQLVSWGLDDDGEFSVSVRVSDGELDDENTAQLIISNVAPANVALTLEPANLDEGGTAALSGTFADPGTADTHTIRIDWGDGQSSSIVLTSGERSFSAQHTYRDDGQYTASVLVTDDDGGSGQSGDSVYAASTLDFDHLAHSENGINVATVTEDGYFLDYPTHPYAQFLVYGVNHPAYTGSPALATAYEGQTIELTRLDGAAFRMISLDLSELSPNMSVHSPASVTFQGEKVDGSVVTVTFTTTANGVFGPETFAFGSEFTDLVALRWSSGITADKTVHQFDNIIVEARVPGMPNPRLTVNNVRPTITAITTTADEVGGAAPAQSTSFTATFTDPGAVDTFTALIDWGDGSSSPATVQRTSTTGGVVTATHAYAQGGVYTAQLVLTDNAGGEDAAQASLYITGARIEGGILQIVGTRGDDNITIQTHKKQGTRVTAAFLPSGTFPFNPSAVSSIEAYLGDGNDRFSMNDSLKQAVVVVGGTGADQIDGGNGRNILIGGQGADTLVGGSNQDILIAGSTTYDHHPAALRAILREWNSGRTFQQRVANLYNGSGSTTRFNGNYFLTVGAGGSVADDEERDSLSHGGGTDWMFHTAGQDQISGKIRGDIFANDLDSVLGP